MNKEAEFEGLRVHGLLTDLEAFYFYSYDPIQKRFAFDKTLVTSIQRDAFIGDMIHGMWCFQSVFYKLTFIHIVVTNKIFSVVLFAYVKGLAASIKANSERLPVLPPAVSWLFSDFMANI